MVRGRVRSIIPIYISTILHEWAIATLRSRPVPRKRIDSSHGEPVEIPLHEAHLQCVVVGIPSGFILIDARKPRELAVIRLPKLIASGHASGSGARQSSASPGRR